MDDSSENYYRRRRLPTRYNNDTSQIMSSCPMCRTGATTTIPPRMRRRRKEPCMNDNIMDRRSSRRRNSKSTRIRQIPSLVSSGGGHSKRFILLCTCLHLMSFTTTTIMAEGSAPAEERRYLRSYRAESMSSGATDNEALDYLSEEEEEEEFDYEKFHAKHHIPLPALGAVGYYGQAAMVNNEASLHETSPPQQQDDDPRNPVQVLSHIIQQEDEEISHLQDEKTLDKAIVSSLLPQLIDSTDENEREKDEDLEILKLRHKEVSEQSLSTDGAGGESLVDKTTAGGRDVTEGDATFTSSSSNISSESSSGSITIIDTRRNLAMEDESSQSQELQAQDEAISDLSQDVQEDKYQVLSLLSKLSEKEEEDIANLKLDMRDYEGTFKFSPPVTEPSHGDEDQEEEEFDYETYHSKHNIPLPALGVSTMMGLMTPPGAMSVADPRQQDDPQNHVQWLSQLQDEEISHLQDEMTRDKAVISALLPQLIDSSYENEREIQEEDSEISKLRHEETIKKARLAELLSKVNELRGEENNEEMLKLREKAKIEKAQLSELLYKVIGVIDTQGSDAQGVLDSTDTEITALLKKEENDKKRLAELLSKEVMEGGTNMLGLQEHDAEILDLLKEGNRDKLKYKALLAQLEEKSAPKGILAFAGTNMAMKNFASFGYINDVDEGDEIMDETTSSSGIPSMYENTLASISKYRYSLLGSNSLDSGEEGDSLSSIYDTSVETHDMELQDSEESSSQVDDLADSSASASLAEEFPSIDDTDATFEKSSKHQGSVSNLERGRHLVGLEVREVRPHEQIIVDYQDIVSDYDYDEHEQTIRPLRIKYLIPDYGEGGDVSMNSHLLPLLLNTAFNHTASLWSQALSLPPVMDNIIPTVAICGGANIPELHRENGVENADILVYVSGDNTFCGGAIMHSSICDFDQNMRPLVANINICTKNIPNVTMTTELPEDNNTHAVDEHTMISTNVLRDYNEYISTETARILGASTTLFQYYRNSDSDTAYGITETYANCVDGSQESISLPNVISEDVDSDTGKVFYEIRTPRVIEVVRNHFNCMTLTGARMEVKKGGISCFGGFLDDRIFFGEQVSGFQVVPPQHKERATISPLTLALLEDSSWYTANYTISTEMPFGRGAGCQFAHVGGGTCVVDDEGTRHVQVSDTHGKGFHCSAKGKLGCDATHSFKAKCDLLHYPTDVASFSSLVPSSSDVCPMHIRGAIDCSQEGPAEGYDTTSSTGEVYGESSKCFLTEEGEPLCLQGTCNEEKQGVDITFEDEVYTCTRDGEMIDTKNGLRIECPRIAAICPSLICPSNCSGRGVCDEDREGRQACICDDPFDDSPGCWGQN